MLYVHDHCWEIIQARATSLNDTFREVAKVGQLQTEGDVLAIAIAAGELLAEALANLSEPDRSEWLEKALSFLPDRVTKMRAMMEAHPVDCPHCARRQQERANVQ